MSPPSRTGGWHTHIHSAGYLINDREQKNTQARTMAKNINWKSPAPRSIIVPPCAVTELVFYIRHRSGCLCGARRPIGLIGDRLRPLVNRSPRQRAPLTAFCPHYSWIKEKPVTAGLELRPSRKSLVRVYRWRSRQLRFGRLYQPVDME